jgi:hypothetical protein
MQDEKLKKSFAIHLLATLKRISIDDFYEMFVVNDDNIDNEEFTNYDYFLKDFRPEVEQFMLENRDILDKEIEGFDSQKYSSLL